MDYMDYYLSIPNDVLFDQCLDDPTLIPDLIKLRAVNRSYKQKIDALINLLYNHISKVSMEQKIKEIMHTMVIPVAQETQQRIRKRKLDKLGLPDALNKAREIFENYYIPSDDFNEVFEPIVSEILLAKKEGNVNMGHLYERVSNLYHDHYEPSGDDADVLMGIITELMK